MAGIVPAVNAHLMLNGLLQKFLKVGHVLMDTTLIHGVTVDAVLMIQYVMIRMQVSGTTAEQQAA
jgi:hypothetical protein